MNELIKLIAVEYGSDDIGNDVASPVERQVFCTVDSISQSEFFAAAQNGYKAEYRFKVWTNEYNGETKVKYGEKEYFVYRTYTKDDYTDLYCRIENEEGESQK